MFGTEHPLPHPTVHYNSSFDVVSQAGRKKVFMLFNLEPDTSVTGGAWYSDQDFESEFVEVLNQQCFKFLQQKVKMLFQEWPSLSSFTNMNSKLPSGTNMHMNILVHLFLFIKFQSLPSTTQLVITSCTQHILS